MSGLRDDAGIAVKKDMAPIAFISGHCGGLLAPTPKPMGAGARVPLRGEVEKREAAAHAPTATELRPKLLGVRRRIMDYAVRVVAAHGHGPTLAEIEGFLEDESFLAQGHVYWLEAEGYLRAERTDGNRRRLSPTRKEYAA